MNQERRSFRIPRGVDHIISVRPRWSGADTSFSAGYMIVRVWHDGYAEDVAGPLTHTKALAHAEERAAREGTVYLRAPDDAPVNAPGPLFGEVPGVTAGRRFRRRDDLRAAGLHRRVQQGIDWTSEGALAIVFSGMYADDEWSETNPWYTGMGGQDAVGGRQVRDQEPVLGNRALIRNFRDGLPVRVIRRVARGNDHEYVYEGLYYVVDYTHAPSKDGPKVFRFRLGRVTSQSRPSG